MNDETQRSKRMGQVLHGLWGACVVAHSYEWLFFLIGVSLLIGSRHIGAHTTSELVRDAGIAFMISVLLTVLLDGRLRRKHNTELLEKIDSTLDHVSTSIRQQHQDVATVIAGNQRQLIDQIKVNAQSIQNRLVQDALTFKFGKDVMDEICKTITEAPFYRSGYEIDFEFSSLPKDWSLNNEEYILLRMTVECTITNVAFEPVDYASYLPSLGLAASESSNEYQYSGVIVDGSELASIIDPSTGRILTTDEIIVQSNESIRVVYRIEIPRRRNDHEVFFTYLPSKDLTVTVHGFRDINIENVKLQATHRKGVIPKQMGIPPKKPDRYTWTFPTALIPFQGFELAWTSLDTN